jgi:hypothetical protein
VRRPAVRAYAARASQSVDEYLVPMSPLVTPENRRPALLELVRRDVATASPAYLLTGAGLEEPHGD